MRSILSDQVDAHLKDINQDKKHECMWWSKIEEYNVHSKSYKFYVNELHDGDLCICILSNVNILTLQVPNKVMPLEFHMYLTFYPKYT